MEIKIDAKYSDDLSQYVSGTFKLDMPGYEAEEIFCAYTYKEGEGEDEQWYIEFVHRDSGKFSIYDVQVFTHRIPRPIKSWELKRCCAYHIFDYDYAYNRVASSEEADEIYENATEETFDYLFRE